MSARPPSELPLHVRPVSSLTPRPLTALWPGRLAEGKLAILDGDPGLGKSLLALDLAARYRCVILLIRHLNKAAGSRALYRGLASIAFAALCRSAYLVARDPDDPARCVLAEVKNNLGPPQPSLAYAARSEGSQPVLD